MDTGKEKQKGNLCSLRFTLSCTIYFVIVTPFLHFPWLCFVKVLKI